MPDPDRWPTAPPPTQLPVTFREGWPGSEARTCVDVGGRPYVRSGEIVAGDFRAYVDVWHRRPGSEKLAWFPLHEELLDARRVPRPPTLLVLGTRLDGSERFFDEVLIGTMATSPPQLFFPGFSRLPAPGRWRLVAVSGPDWGCFEFTL